MTTAEQVLSLARSYVEALDSKRYSTAHQALTLLANATRQLPAWLESAEVEPETHIRQDLGDGAAYDIGISDRFLRLVMVDVTGDDVMHHFEPELAKAFLDDMRRVLAAMERAA